MGEMKRGKGDMDDSSYVPINKTQVLQEAKQCFMATPGKTKRLIDVLTNCILILLQGEKLSSTEATDLFFHITRLYQYNDQTLRRLTHIGIKLLSRQVDNVFVVTSSLIADLNSSTSSPALRASALRTLCQISDATTLNTIERYLKQAILDEQEVVASAALTSLIKIARSDVELVRQFSNEINTAHRSDSPMVRYHALALRCMMCKDDRVLTSRLLASCSNSSIRSPLEVCLLLRTIYQSVRESPDRADIKEHLKYIRSRLDHDSDIVRYESVETLIGLRQLHLKNLKSSITDDAIIYLKELLYARKPALKFAAVRSLNQLATTAPDQVRACNLDLEQLISETDCNRSIASLAITTLLKTGTESTVEKFLKQIAGFLSEIDDNFKVAVVGSVGQLCQKYPSKHSTMLNFLFTMLREEGGFKYKESIVDTIIAITENHPAAKEEGSEILCEFIEDCEFEELAIKALGLLGREGPRTGKSRSYIRYIENRLKLDVADVCCAAVDALSKFGTIDELSRDIGVLLERAKWHEDPGVMEKAVFYQNLLNSNQHELMSRCTENMSKDVDLTNLEQQLMSHLDTGCDEPFEPNLVRVVTKRNENPVEPEPVTPESLFPDLDLGLMIGTSDAVPLTDSRVSEIVVTCTRHTYKRYIVLQFDCTNTVNTMNIENVSIEMEEPDGFKVLACTECPKLTYGVTAPIFVCVELIDDACREVNYFTDLSLKFDIINEGGTNITGEMFPLEDMLIDLSN